MSKPLPLESLVDPRVLAVRADAEALRVLLHLPPGDARQGPSRSTAPSLSLLRAAGATLAVVVVIALYVLVVMQLF